MLPACIDILDALSRFPRYRAIDIWVFLRFVLTPSRCSALTYWCIGYIYMLKFRGTKCYDSMTCCLLTEKFRPFHMRVLFISDLENIYSAYSKICNGSYSCKGFYTKIFNFLFIFYDDYLTTVRNVNTINTKCIYQNDFCLLILI